MRIVYLTGLLLAVSFQCFSQTIPDSVLRQMLTRAVYSWQEGRAREAFLTLDSVIAQPITDQNAGSKVKAALWTSNYLMEQKKMQPAKTFIDSALAWSKRFPMEEGPVRVYQALSQWHAAIGDARTALRFKDLEWEFRDSLNRLESNATIDSLQKTLAKVESATNQPEEDQGVEEGFSTPDGSESSADWLWVLIPGLLLVSGVLVYLVRTKNNRRPAVDSVSSVPATPSFKPAEPSGGNGIPVFEFQPTETKIAPTVERLEPVEETPPPPNRETLLRLKGVELVLIRAEVLAAYQNGDLKAVRNLLNEYMAQLPFIMKTLDEAINRNETAPILLSLQHVKSYLKLFGMKATEKLIREVESESSTEKVSKLLSRVFQVRNHCRRAADEAKSLLEKIG